MYFTVHVFCEIATGGGHCLKKKKRKLQLIKSNFLCRVLNTARKSTTMWPKP